MDFDPRPKGGLAGQFEWRAALRAARKARRLTQGQVAARAGLSVAAIKAYERGDRHPSPQALGAVIDALGLTRDEANPLRAGAGYAVDWYSLLHRRYVSEPERLAAEVERYPWPSFITDQGIGLVEANRVFQRVWDVDLSRELTGPGQRNFLAGVSDPRFARYMANFDELVTFMIGLAKGDPRWQQSIERPAPWLEAPLARFLEGDPKLIRHVTELWERAQPIPHRARHTYEVRWLYQGERPLRFIGLLTIGDVWAELSWNDWIPADVASWRALSEIVGEL